MQQDVGARACDPFHLVDEAVGVQHVIKNVGEDEVVTCVSELELVHVTGQNQRRCGDKVNADGVIV